jgi:hypothetical protein
VYGIAGDMGIAFIDKKFDDGIFQFLLGEFVIAHSAAPIPVRFRHIFSPLQQNAEHFARLVQQPEPEGTAGSRVPWNRLLNKSNNYLEGN